RVDVALAQDDVVIAPDLDLVAVLGVEQHLVPDLHGPDVGADGHHLGPRQPLGHLGGRGDGDGAARGAGPAAPPPPPASRLDIWAVAGMRMPPDEVRSPSDPDRDTSTRSLSILMSSLSPPERPLRAGA